MRKLAYSERYILKGIFNIPTSAVILASFYTDIGEAWINDLSMNQNGIIFVENTFYIGGQFIDKELTDFLMKQIVRKKMPVCYIIPQNNKMTTYLDEYYKQKNLRDSIIKSERHLMDINMNIIDYDCLKSFVNELPEKYQLKPLDEDLF